jgi:hypothetical protein
MSATALIRFAEMHLSAGIIDGARVLSVDAVRAMQQLQFEQPGLAPTRQGLGWMLSSVPEIVGHGGDTIGVFANLKLVPERGIAVAVLTNSDHGSALTADLVGPLLRDLAGLEPQPPATVPAPGAEISNPDRYVGTYGVRTRLEEITVANGRLWMRHSDRGEALDMAALGGVPAQTSRRELRRLDGDTFAAVDESGAFAGTAEFFGTDGAARAAFVDLGRTIPRIT